MTLYVMLCTNNSPFLTLRYMTQSYHGRWGNRRADDALTLIFGKVFFFLATSSGSTALPSKPDVNGG